MKRLISIPFVFLFLPLFAQFQKADIDVFNQRVQEFIYTDLDTAYYFANKALVESRNINYKKGEMQAQFQIGRIYFDQARRFLSLEAGKKSLQIAKEIDNYNGKKDAYNLIVKIYLNSKKNDDGIKTSREILNLSITENDSSQLAKTYNNLGIFKRRMHETDSSLYYKLKSIKINRKLKNKKALAYNYTSFGIYHYDLGNIDSAFSYLRKSLKIRTSLNLVHQAIESYNNVGYLFLMSENPDSAAHYFKKSIEYCLRHEKKSYLEVIYKNLSKAYAMDGKYEEAFNTIKKSIPIKDSLIGIKQHEQIVKKGKELSEYKEERLKQLKKQNSTKFILITILLILLVSIIIMLNISKKNRIKSIIERQKRLAAKTIIDEYEKIDEWISQELHDNIGGSIAAIRLRMLETLDVIREQQEKVKKENKEIFEMNLKKLNLLVTTRSQEIELLNEVYKNIRTLSHNLAPSSFAGGKFVSLLQENISSRFPKSIRHSIIIEPEEELIEISDDLKFNVYRILQNLSSNIVLHSRARNSSIKVLGEKNHLKLVVQDDGIGFNTKTHHGLGLDLVQKRVLLFDGTIDLDSQINKGTRINIMLPYKNKIIE